MGHPWLDQVVILRIDLDQISGSPSLQFVRSRPERHVGDVVRHLYCLYPGQASSHLATICCCACASVS